MVHKYFRLNGISHDSSSLVLQANVWIQEGQKEYLVDLANLILAWFNKEETIELRTSGTTGPPKTIYLQKKAMIASAKATGSFFKKAEGTQALLCMSTKFVGGKLMLIRALTLGWHLDVVEPTARPMVGSDAKYDFVAMVAMNVER